MIIAKLYVAHKIGICFTPAKLSSTISASIALVLHRRVSSIGRAVSLGLLNRIHHSTIILITSAVWLLYLEHQGYHKAAGSTPAFGSIPKLVSFLFDFLWFSSKILFGVCGEGLFLFFYIPLPLFEQYINWVGES